jgi:hypothetical protein
MHLSNQTLHLLHQGLFTLTKMQQPPERGRQVIKLSHQDYFPVAWDLHGFAVRLGLIPPESRHGWRKALSRLRSGEAPVDEDGPPRRRSRPRRRRPRRKA